MFQNETFQNGTFQKEAVFQNVSFHYDTVYDYETCIKMRRLKMIHVSKCVRRLQELTPEASQVHIVRVPTIRPVVSHICLSIILLSPVVYKINVSLSTQILNVPLLSLSLVSKISFILTYIIQKQMLVCKTAQGCVSIVSTLCTYIYKEGVINASPLTLDSSIFWN